MIGYAPAPQILFDQEPEPQLVLLNTRGAMPYTNIPLGSAFYGESPESSGRVYKGQSFPGCKSHIPRNYQIRQSNQNVTQLI